MTKEEALNKFIERYKSYVNKRFVNLVDCCGMGCEICPFRGDQCADDVVMAIIDHFVKAEEKKETNLEHYFEVGDVIVYGAQQYIYLNDNCWYAYDKSKSSHIVQWLLSPYEEPPKPKYKLSKFEYDLLKCYDVERRISEFWLLDKMHKKGYFKGVPDDIPINKILANCEVTDESV